MTAPMRGRRERGVVCRMHGDDHCDRTGEAGPPTRTDERREAQREIDDETLEPLAHLEKEEVQSGAI